MPSICKTLLLLTVLFSFGNTHGQQLRLALDSVAAYPGNQVEIALRARNFQAMLSAQGTVGFDPQTVQFDQVTAFGLPGMSASNFGTSLIGDGLLTFSWDDASLQGKSIPDDSALFKLSFTLSGAPGAQSNLVFAGSPVPLECADTSFTVLPLDTVPGLIRVLDTVTVGLAAAVGSGPELRVWPHPLEPNSRIRLQWEQDEELRLCLLDMQGRKLGETRRVCAAGMTEFAFSELFPDVPAGLYLLLCEGHTGNRSIRTLMK